MKEFQIVFVECRLLRQLAKDNPQAFLCHFYNIYFAHTAGGRMIGTKVCHSSSGF